MKNLSSNLLEYLQSDATVECFISDLFTIKLASGTIFYATSGQLDLFWGMNTFRATTYGLWQKDTVTIQIGTGSSSTQISVYASPSVYMPGTTTPLLSAIAQGLFDGAQILVQTAYSPIGQYENIQGVETKFLGTMGAIQSLGRASCVFSVNDLMYRLNLQMPRNVVQSGCRHTLFDAGCTLSASAYQENHTVASGSTQLIFTLVGSTGNVPPWFSQGFVTMTSGANNGLSMMIKEQLSTTQFQIMKPFLLPVNPGDTFAAFPGCDKSQETCLTKYNNLAHLASFPNTPSPETVL